MKNENDKRLSLASHPLWIFREMFISRNLGDSCESDSRHLGGGIPPTSISVETAMKYQKNKWSSNIKFYIYQYHHQRTHMYQDIPYQEHISYILSSELHHNQLLTNVKQVRLSYSHCIFIFYSDHQIKYSIQITGEEFANLDRHLRSSQATNYESMKYMNE